MRDRRDDRRSRPHPAGAGRLQQAGPCRASRGGLVEPTTEVFGVELDWDDTRARVTSPRELHLDVALDRIDHRTSVVPDIPESQPCASTVLVESAAAACGYAAASRSWRR
jgi:hypothetical protein